MQVSSDRQLPKKVLVGQFLTVLLVALVWLFVDGVSAAVVGLFCGVALLLPNALLAWRIHRLGVGANPRLFMRAIYISEALKFVLVAAVFAVVTIYFADYFFPAFSACMSTLIMAWVVPFWHTSRTIG